MKNVRIECFSEFTDDPKIVGMPKTLNVVGEDNMSVSDGYHTFDELYDHRITLYIALCRTFKFAAESEGGNSQVWRTYNHSDGSTMEGWFVLGIGKEPGKQITYHLPLNRWVETDFAEELDKAPEFDGHTSADVLVRLKEL